MKKGIIFGLALVMLLACISGVSALPATTTSVGDYCQGTSNTVTCTVSGNVSTDSWSGACVSVRSGASGAFVIKDCSASVNFSTYTFTVNSVGITDTTAAYMNCTLYINATVNISTVTMDTCVLDNTAPSVTVKVEHDPVRQRNWQEVKCDSSSDATAGISTYSILLRKPSGINTSAYTPSGGRQTFYPDDLLEVDGYRAYCTVTDKAGNSAQSYVGFDSLSEFDEVSAATAEKEKKSRTGVIAIVAILCVLAIIGVIAVAINKKSKKRR